MPRKTKTGRDKPQTRFKHDLSKRCLAEFACSFKACVCNKNLFYRTMSHIVDVMNLCYLGDLRLCTVNSCLQKSRLQLAEKSTHFSSDFKTDRTLKNAVELRKWIEKSSKQPNLVNHSKVEATNRPLRRSLPRNVTFSKTFTGLAHSAVHNVNNGPDQSLYLLKAA
ncbi:LOW QUALITY PROTEIN: hypothetical protein KUTeg_000611 [Tegillarca granosa]|uniref:Uncharacterized protein n=1 Tax=Tegillarca granosa TaxID=220873 RepID=A0ABQ9G2D9_TEGGR|nr:LOW QUALITY PROTEIN: hypothetical protein KUTeg_000611 [Tegillarca granosa]